MGGGEGMKEKWRLVIGTVRDKRKEKRRIVIGSVRKTIRRRKTQENVNVR